MSFAERSFWVAKSQRKVSLVVEGLTLLAIVVFCLVAVPVNAATMWTDWTTATTGGSASGSAGGIGLSYAGELDGAVINGTGGIWLPSTTFVGGTVTTSPDTIRDYLRIDGNGGRTNTIVFASPVVDPVIAIWSLGATNTSADFTFDQTPTLEVGGRNSIYGGSSIIVSGNTVSGREGNGVVQFTGVFSSISWTNTYENYYAFTVGHNGPAPVPLPAALLLFAPGLVGMAAVRRRFEK
jgi:hypothetical protein